MFSFNRYCNLIVDDLRTNARSKFIGLLAAFGVIIVLITMFLLSMINEDYIYDNYRRSDPTVYLEKGIFIFALFAMAMYGGSSTFSVLKDKPRRISYLMRPATNLEKYLSRVTIFSVIFPLVFIVGFILIDLLRYAMVPIFFEYFPENLHTILNPMYWHEDRLAAMIITILTLQSTFVLGSAIWPKKGLIYTILALFAIGLSTFWWGVNLLNTYIYPEMEYGWEFFDTNQYTLYIIPSVITCIVNYIIAYFRFKEIEIIQRW